jgi:multicomponent Na+:H+ antiporter subunit C
MSQLALEPTSTTGSPIFLAMAGLFIVIARGNLIKKLVGLASSRPRCTCSTSRRASSSAARRRSSSDAFTVYSNPLPHVLILTAIVVGVATLALGLALVVRIREAYGSIEEDEILRPRCALTDAAHRSASVAAMNLTEHLPILQVVLPLPRAAGGAAARPRCGLRAGAGGDWALSRSASCCGCRSASGADLLRHRQLAAALGHRVPRRRALGAGADAGLGIAAVVLPYSRASIEREIARTALPVLRDVRAVPDRAARHHHHRRRLQPLRLPGDLVALDLRADRPRPRTAARWWPPTST